jgi:hypothetical protein
LVDLLEHWDTDKGMGGRGNRPLDKVVELGVELLVVGWAEATPVDA